MHNVDLCALMSPHKDINLFKHLRLRRPLIISHQAYKLTQHRYTPTLHRADYVQTLVFKSAMWCFYIKVGYIQTPAKIVHILLINPKIISEIHPSIHYPVTAAQS